MERTIKSSAAAAAVARDKLGYLYRPENEEAVRFRGS